MHPRDITISDGGRVVLSIDARGAGRTWFIYEWKKVGSDSLPDTASGGNSTELTITSVTSSDSGLYYCIVMNQWGNMVKSNNATVNVLCKLVLRKDVLLVRKCCEFSMLAEKLYVYICTYVSRIWPDIIFVTIVVIVYVSCM